MTDSDRSQKPRMADWLVLFSFLAILVLPAVAGLVHYDPAPPLMEKRRPADLKNLEWNTIELLPGLFEEYYQDHFGLRASLVRVRNFLKLTIFGLADGKTVVAGLEGQLYYKEDVENHFDRRPFSQAQLSRWQRDFERVRDQLAGRGIHYLLVIVPTSCTVYPELLPARLHRPDKPSPIDQFVHHMRRHSTVPLLDLRGPLIEAKAQGRVYYRTDTHWTELGALIAYQEMVGSLGRWYPEMKPMSVDFFRQRLERTDGRDLAVALGLSKILTEAAPTLIPKSPWRAQFDPPDPYGHVFYRSTWLAPQGERPSLLLIHDSFGFYGLNRFLAEEFRSGRYAATVRTKGSRKMDLDAISESVVIEETVERLLFEERAQPP